MAAESTAKLIKACRQGEIDTVKELVLVSLLNVNTADDDGNTPLLHALRCGREDVTKWLLEAGADPNTADLNGTTPLHVAAAQRNGDAVKLLIKHRARPDVENRDGKLPVDLAPDDTIKSLLSGWKETQIVENNTYDEVLEVSQDSTSVAEESASFDVDRELEKMKKGRESRAVAMGLTARDGHVSPSELKKYSSYGDKATNNDGEDSDGSGSGSSFLSDDEDYNEARRSTEASKSQLETSKPAGQRAQPQKYSSSEESEEESESDLSSEDDEGQEHEGFKLEDSVIAKFPEYVKDIMKYVDMYKPTNHELEAALKPFVPEYLPAVGDIDAFIKVPVPVGEDKPLGLTILDEPSLNMTDPNLLHNELRALHTSTVENAVPTIERAAEKGAQITKWIEGVNAIHAKAATTNVIFPRPMPDIESLLQVWPEQVETVLQTTRVPSASIALSTEEYARLLTAVLDIPVYPSEKGGSSLVHALYMAFSVYSEFKDNQHFNKANPLPDIATVS